MTLSQIDEKYLIEHLRTIPNFPVQGINFRDVTSRFKDPESMEIIKKELYELFKDKHITKVVGIESRWFVFAAILASVLKAWFVPVRKPWKLPGDVIGLEYTKEYGKDRIEIHNDAITPDDIVVVHDDLLATWGTMLAAYQLVNQNNPKNIHVNSLITIWDEWLCWKDYLTENGVPEDNITTILDL